MKAKSLSIAAFLALVAIAAYYGYYQRHSTMPVAAVRPAMPVPSTARDSSSACDTDPTGNGEPRVLPGDSLDSLHRRYGAETKREDDGGYTWKQPGLTLRALPLDDGGIVNGLTLEVDRGHAVQTIDGVTLGKDTFASILVKAKALRLKVHERMDGPEGNWTLTIDFPSRCHPNLVSKYFWSIEGSAKIDQEIVPKTQVANAPWHSDIFLDKICYSYTIEQADDYDRDEEGYASTHIDPSTHTARPQPARK